MPRILYLCSGNYGAGKTYFAHLNVGQSNTIALATPIRKYLFQLFHDERVHSTDQKTKESRFPKTPIIKLLNRHTPPPKFPKRLFINFQTELGEMKSLDNVSVRDLLIALGNAGRACNKQFWVNETIKLLGEISRFNNIAVDDVRFMNEKKKLLDFCSKNGIIPISVFVGEPDDKYENQELYNTADYRIDWRRNEV